MKEKNTNIFKFYVSNISIWWNKGLEAKPSFSWFVKNIDWEEITDTENFTVSWEDETHIKVIIPLSKRNHLIRIENINLATNQYYFLVEELNRTNKNIEAIFQLDIWSSYLMRGEYLQDNLRTTQNLDINGVSEYVNILPNGIPTGRQVTKLVDLTFQNNFYIKDKPEIVQQYGQCFKWIKKQNKVSQSLINWSDIFYGADSNIYFVFTERITRDNDLLLSKNNKSNYILIPVLSLTNLNIFSVIPMNFPTFSQDGYNHLGVTMLLNDFNVLTKIVENKSNDHLGLGEFVGVWVGPSFYRFEELGINNKFQQIKQNMFIWESFYLAFSNNIGLESELNKWGIRAKLGNINSNFNEVINEVNANIDQYKGNKFNTVIGTTNLLLEDKIGSVVCIRISSDFIPLSDINVSREEFVKNINYLGNPNNFITTKNSKVFFNQKFTFSNGKDTGELDIQVPVAYDNYQNMINAQRNTMNTSLWVSGANSIFSLANQLVGGVGSIKLNDIEKHQISKNIVLSGRTALQFFNTLAQQEAYKRDLRTTISNTVTNMNDIYTTYFSNVKFKVSEEDKNILLNSRNINETLSILAKDIFFGYEVEPSKLTKFYGYEDIPRLITKEFYKSNDCYIKIDELTKLELDLHLTKTFTPTIKEAIITLLYNGVRVVNNPTDLDI